jgi:hypothetical protein
MRVYNSVEEGVGGEVEGGEVRHVIYLVKIKGAILHGIYTPVTVFIISVDHITLQ